MSICIYNYGCVCHVDDWNFSVPGSVFWRIYLIVSGSSNVRINDTMHTLKPGYAYIIPAFVPHQDILDGTFVHKYIHFRLDDRQLEEYIQLNDLPFEVKATPVMLEIFNRLDTICKGFSLETPVPHQYEKKSSYIYWTKRYMALPFNIRYELENCVKLLLAQFINHARKNKEIANPGLISVRRYIDTHLDSQLNIETLAEIAGIRPESLIRTFNRVYRQTPHAYITERRINRAKDLLLLSTLSVKEIAAKVGFKDTSHFCTVFKKETSLSPGSYRNTGH